MFMTKKLLLATALAAVTLTAAGSTWAKELTIGLAVANLQADFFNQIKQSVEAEGKARGVKIITVDAQGNSSTQVSQIEDLITRQIDALIYIPAGATAAGVPVKAAKA
ncbi:substrate-binding domain-containing protein, partial [Pseudomonas savastanoi]